MLTLNDMFISADMLNFAKNGVRNGGVAVTETATPFVRDMLTRQLQQCIQSHAAIFYYMLSRDLYPSYDVERLVAVDFRAAQAALAMPVR